MKYLILLIAIVASFSACGSPTDTDGELPLLLAIRNDAPYITGRITERWTEGNGAVRLLVKAPDPASVRVGAAVVTIANDAIVVRTDGSAAGRDVLDVGRRVAVWVTGPELRSLPPQVTGDAFLLYRW